jgi:hypothetical protein
MDTLRERVVSALRRRFPDLVVDELEEIPETNRVTGVVASGVFAGVDDRTRQEQLWEVLKKDLQPEDLPHVGPIVALTPMEADIDTRVDRN